MEPSPNILDRLASSLGKRDEMPNEELAKAIAAAGDTASVQSLVDHLGNKSSAIQSDCIKVLYEIGALKPQLIAPHLEVFLPLLRHKNNRLQWGAMTALHSIAALNPAGVYGHLSHIMAATDSGSVITRDHGVGILIELLRLPEYAGTAFPLLLEQLQKCPSNQLPMYAEQMLPVLALNQKGEFAEALRARLGDFEKESKRSRVEKVLKKLGKEGKQP